VSWYRLIIIFAIALIQCTYAKELMRISDDELIVRGILYDEYKAYENSRQIYSKLYDATNEEIYLFKEATASLLGRTHMDESIERLKAWDVKYPDKPEVQRLLIPLYLTVNKIDEAKIQAGYLVEHSSAPEDLELASHTFLYSGDFKRALALLNKAYASEPNETILLRMVTIMDEYTNKWSPPNAKSTSYRRP